MEELTGFVVSGRMGMMCLQLHAVARRRLAEIVGIVVHLETAMKRMAKEDVGRYTATTRTATHRTTTTHTLILEMFVGLSMV